MGRKGDQNFIGQTYRPECRDMQSEQSRLAHHPSSSPTETTLSPSSLVGVTEAPPPYTEVSEPDHFEPSSCTCPTQEPLSLSMPSPMPQESSARERKQKILLVYIHGFMGNETSFQSFPAHVHNVIATRLAESHVVHTKIYPRYKSRKHIEFARDSLSEWLRPHEGPGTNIILLGHSMGGILAAEVALLESHRILGLINFDTPFLGMHPGVIVSGLGSLFRPAPESPGPTSTDEGPYGQGVSGKAANEGNQASAPSSYFGANASPVTTLMPSVSNSQPLSSNPSSSSLDLPVKDPNYDPPFVNDVRLPQRTGWANALHYINKHSDGLTKATQSYVQSHFEFGGAMADYNGLNKRYEKVRALEGLKTGEDQAKRVMFVNYYTASTGRPKKVSECMPVEKSQDNDALGKTPIAKDGSHDTTSVSSLLSRSRESMRTTNHDVSAADADEDTDEGFLSTAEGHTDDQGVTIGNSYGMDAGIPSLTFEDEPYDDLVTRETSETTASSISDLDSSTSIAPSVPPPTREIPNLPPVPPVPDAPALFDPFIYNDKDTRKLAEKDHTRMVKRYQQAVRDREKAINHRRKFLEKREKVTRKEHEKQTQAKEKEEITREKRVMEKGEQERANIERATAKKLEKEKAKEAKAETKKATKEKQLKTNPRDHQEARSDKVKREKQFCMLPPRYNGEIDPCWVRVFMPGVDEVGAHCGLFTVDGERYQSFVDDVARRIEMWVREAGN